ncbi:hypothetical protein TNCV_4067041 [Trichonephila clavipes]|nr:hypothetical protein TNCV_4067041 [Trichonephila clavipes]
MLHQQQVDKLQQTSVLGNQHKSPGSRSGIKQLIQSIFWITDTEDPFLAETMKRPKTCSEQHQQSDK